MNVLKRMWTAITNKTAFERYLDSFIGGADTESSNTSGKMMRYSAVFSCIRVLSETFASVAPSELKMSKDGNNVKTNDTGLLKLFVSKPNRYMNAFNFWEMAIVQLNLYGNFYCLKDYDRIKNIISLRPLQSDNVNVIIDDKGTIKYKLSGQNDKEYTRQEIFHIVGYSQDGINGMSPLSYFSDMYGLGLTYQNFSTKYYKNGILPSGAFSLPDNKFLSDKAYERLREDLKKRYSGEANLNKFLLLEDGLTFKQMSISPVDAQLIENKKFQIEDIARVYRVPLHLIQHLDRATNNNIEHQSLEFVMYSMLPWFNRVEGAINSQLLTDRQLENGYYFEFNMDSLLRGDAAARARYFSSARQWGWMSANDIRKREKMNTIANGDIYLQPSNMMEAGLQLQK